MLRPRTSLHCIFHAGLHQCTAEEETCDTTPTPIHKIPLPGMVRQHHTPSHHTPSHSPLLIPGNTRIIPINKPSSDLQDDNSGDSGMGTGSGEYGFNNVQRYLKVSPVPSKRPRPVPPPKPSRSSATNTAYMPLRTTSELAEYAQLHTPRSNNTTEQSYYSTPTS